MSRDTARGGFLVGPIEGDTWMLAAEQRLIGRADLFTESNLPSQKRTSSSRDLYLMFMTRYDHLAFSYFELDGIIMICIYLRIDYYLPQLLCLSCFPVLSAVL